MRKGFTLLEVLLYSAILAIFLGASFAFISSVLGGTDKLLEQNEVLTNQELIERKLDWLASYATAITGPATNTSSTASFTLTTASSSLNPVVFSKSGDKINLSLADGIAVPLVNERVKVMDFLAEHIRATSSPSVLRFYFALQSVIYQNIISTTSVNYVIPQQ